VTFLTVQFSTESKNMENNLNIGIFVQNSSFTTGNN